MPVELIKTKLKGVIDCGQVRFDDGVGWLVVFVILWGL
jgi:hypothetical protein